jgi:hypothetical protein
MNRAHDNLKKVVDAADKNLDKREDILEKVVKVGWCRLTR